MHLFRSLSSTLKLRGKRPADMSMTGALPAIPEFSTFNVVFNDEFESVDEQALQQAFVESLHEQTRALEQERDTERVARQRAEQSLRVKTAEVDGLWLRVQAGQAAENRDSERIRRLEVSIRNIGEEKKQLERNVEEHVLQIRELEARLKEYQIWSVKAAGEHIAKDAVIAALEAEKKDLARLVGFSEPVVKLQKEKSQLEKRVEVLQAEVVHSRAEGEERTRELEKVRLQNQELGRWVAALNEDVENTAAQMREVEASRVLDASLTPRILVVGKLLLGHARKGVQGSDDAFLQSCLPSSLTSQNLDVELNTNQAKALMENLAVGELIIISCDVCLLPKLAAKPGVARPRLRVDEFTGTSRRTSCCSKAVCRQCFLRALEESSSRDWWTNLGVANWLRCPVSSCEASLNYSFIAGLETLLRQLGGKGTARHLEMYERAEAFRAALARHSPDFSNEALLVASSLQNHLVTICRMHPLFDPMFTNKIPDETGRVPPFNPGRIRTVSVDHNGNNSIDVPLFIRFLRRQETPKSCVVCTDDFFDIHTGSAEEWLELCRGFHGAWMWDVLLSPIKLELECRHTIDFCTTCLRRHLRAQLEQHGRGASGQLSCPSAGCGRKLSYQEIQLYGDPDTFTQYDKYLQLDALSRLPNFRWCLGPGCSNGQLYDDDDDDDDDDGPMDPQMHCNECWFEMCFVHSVPWHAGQSCAQYDSVRAHGDPEFQQTRDWIRDNTKPCPGCSENIQKGEYCFHMTCSRCRYEFCWECLADWKLIAPENTTYKVEAHKRECPFRTNGVAPTQISGPNLQEALTRRRDGR